MKGPFCMIRAKNDEQYRKGAKKRLYIAIILVIIGFLTIAVALCAGPLFDLPVGDRQVGFYSGVGTGIAAGGIVLLIRYAVILSNPEKLHARRLAETDERENEISRRALTVACFTLMAVLYVIGMIGGLFYPVLFKVLMLCISAFLFSFLIARSVYQNKM